MTLGNTNNEPIIQVRNISKQYNIGMDKTYKTFSESFTNAIRHPVKSLQRIGYQHDTFWALKDINFDVNRGEVVGIIGRNGAGKSTLLKILSRITSPTDGEIRLKGRVGSLLEVGTGFHPELTGRENIYFNGAILGMKKKEIDDKFDEIVKFSGVEKFLDTPVKRYSSGMNVRLAFSVAANLDPEILVVDEVLAVGDGEFQKKCLGKMSEVAEGGRTVLFVSHNMGAINSLCSRVLYLNNNRIEKDGYPADIIDYYIHNYNDCIKGGYIQWKALKDAPGGSELKLTSIKLIDKNGEIRSVFSVNEQIKIEICYKVLQKLTDLRFNIGILTPQREIAFVTSDHKVRKLTEVGIYKSTCTIPRDLLNIGRYIVNISCHIPGNKVIIPFKGFLDFSTTGLGNQGSDYSEKWPGIICPKCDWLIEEITHG